MIFSNFRRKTGILLPIIFSIFALCLLTLYSQAAMDSARGGLSLCFQVIIPSLFPFFVLSSLLSGLGFAGYLGRISAPLMSRLFGVSGIGASAFILGISGGYPLGASTVTTLYDSGQCSKDEANKLMCFCNNSGPAFIIGAAGAGIFNSPAAGFLLYVIHVLSAALTGMMLRGKAVTACAEAERKPLVQALPFYEAFPAAVKSSIGSILTICGFVVFFSVVVGVLDALGVMSKISDMFLVFFGLPEGISRSLFTGILELGTGLGSMSGIILSPLSAALCSFIIGWGGLSVHFQVMALCSGRGFRMPRYFAAKALQGLMSFALTLALFRFLV